MDIQRHLISSAAASQGFADSRSSPHLPKENIIIEPFGMNTAPCIARSVWWYLKDRYAKDTPMIVVCPLITNIKDEKAFEEAMRFAPKKRN